MRTVWVSPIVFLLLTVLITLPWFIEPGYLFLLDYVVAPVMSMPMDVWQAGHVSSLIWKIAWWILSYIFPVSLIQKVALSLPFFLSGICMFYLARWLVWKLFPRQGILPAYAAGILYATNPFVFTRVAMGHLYLLLAYAVMPLVLLSVLQISRRATSHQLLRAGSIAALPPLTSVHYGVLVPVFLVSLFRHPYPRMPDLVFLRRAITFLLPLLSVIGISLAVHILTTGQIRSIDPLGPWARALRAPYSGNLLFDTLALTATWKVDLPFFFPYESLKLFGYSATTILFLSLVGLVHLWRMPRWRWLSWRFLFVLIVSAVLAIGVAGKATEPIAAFLYSYVPFWIGMRDSAKFISLIALVESVLFAVGFAAVASLGAIGQKKYSRVFSRIVLVYLLGVVLYHAWPTVYGFQGQIYPMRYPVSWAELHAQFARVTPSPRVLFLPWHMYLSFGFTGGRTIINPAPIYFSRLEIVSGDNSEVGGTLGRPFIYSESTSRLSRTIESLLARRDTIQNFGSELAKMNIEYVMLAKDAKDARAYDFLLSQKDLHIVFERDDLTVWENHALLDK